MTVTSKNKIFRKDGKWFFQRRNLVFESVSRKQALNAKRKWDMWDKARKMMTRRKHSCDKWEEWEYSILIEHVESGEPFVKVCNKLPKRSYQSILHKIKTLREQGIISKGRAVAN